MKCMQGFGGNFRWPGTTRTNYVVALDMEIM